LDERRWIYSSHWGRGGTRRGGWRGWRGAGRQDQAGKRDDTEKLKATFFIFSLLQTLCFEAAR